MLAQNLDVEELLINKETGDIKNCKFNQQHAVVIYIKIDDSRAGTERFLEMI